MTAPAGRADQGPEGDDRILAEALAKRGVQADEIARLLTLGAKTGAKAPQPPQPVADAQAEAHFVPHPTVQFPDLRGSTDDEKQQADRLLLNANILRRRGDVKGAEAEVCAALQLVPGDAAALEMYGDLLQATGRVDDALAAYERSLEVGPGRAGAERKFAALSVQQVPIPPGLYNEAGPRGAHVAVLLSALMPGVGQLYLGDTSKGLLFMLLALIMVYLLGWTGMGWVPHLGPGPAFWPLAIMAAVVYIFNLVDARSSAGRQSKARSGWEV
jgi:tetratricopeptide (TPR) repeat protein